MLRTVEPDLWLLLLGYLALSVGALYPPLLMWACVMASVLIVLYAVLRWVYPKP